MKNNIRYIASILIESESTIAVNSGDQSLLLDNVLARDANGLPYIPGTSIAGVFHHLYQSIYNAEDTHELFGCSQSDAEDKGGKKGEEKGSRLIFSSAHITNADGKTICDGIFNLEEIDYFKKIMVTPERDHVKITDRGVGKKGNKFDRELLFKGTRFGFEIELVGEEKDKASWDNLMKLLEHDLFRLGAGTRNGAGQIKVIGIKNITYDLTSKVELLDYLNKSSNLNNHVYEKINIADALTKENTSDYQIQIKARDFILFGSSFPDKDADNAPKKEKVIEWKNGKYEFKEKYLIPATSIKGALSHRTAFHYNRINQNFIGKSSSIDSSKYNLDIEGVLNEWEQKNTDGWSSDDARWDEEITKVESKNFTEFIEQSEKVKGFKSETDYLKRIETAQDVGENNAAVKLLFGCKKDSITEQGQRGRILIEDIYLDTNKDKCVTHVFNHVKIDRFTGGAYDGALFQEKALYYKDLITLNISIDKNYIDQESEVYKKSIEAFEAALNDLKNGNLALGGATTKGFGTFQTQS
ncbi:RAMP superfamily CRISPR-associated protein [bacterium]|nr:RAMP superfamily CRISPR-associated protein [bacterium]